jgi:rSAM/selenodomain-associated transferase 2
MAQLMAGLSLSIVIPNHGDGDVLASLLPTLSKHDCEIIVVGSEADAGIQALCQRYNAQFIHTQPCRGAQLDLGARQARGEIIWFLHADAAPPGSGPELIRATVAAGAVAGYFRFCFAGEASLSKTLLANAINLRVAVGGIPYGDQGLFVVRSTYVAVGGFPHQPLFEEVPLIQQLRRQGSVERIDTPVMVATRRWERDGWWRRSLHNRWLALQFMLGTKPENLAVRYRRKPE